MKRKILTALLCGAAALLAGCNPMDDTAQNTESDAAWQEALQASVGGKPNELPDTLELEVSDTLTFDAELGVSHSLSDYQVPTLTVSRHLLSPTEDVDKLLNYFQVADADIEDRSYSNKEDVLENGQEIYADTVYLDGDGMIQVRDWYFTVSLPGVSDTYYFQGFDNRYKTDDLTLFHWLNKDEELGFCTIENAKAAVQELFESMELEFMEEPRVYSASKQVLKDMAEQAREEAVARQLSEEEIEARYPLDITEEQEVYYLVYRQGYEGVPYMFKDADSSLSNTTMTFGGCEVLYGADGIYEISSKCLYDIEQVQETEEILSAQKILEDFINRYMDNPQNRLVRGLDLEYLLVLKDGNSLTFEAKPVWIISLHRTAGESILPEYIIYDAVTGEELDVKQY